MKKISRRNSIFWDIEQIGKCDVCDEKATYKIHAFSLFGLRLRNGFLCDKHRLEFINGNLEI